jgi:hypothetical protein
VFVPVPVQRGPEHDEQRLVLTLDLRLASDGCGFFCCVSAAKRQVEVVLTSSRYDVPGRRLSSIWPNQIDHSRGKSLTLDSKRERPQVSALKIDA